MAMTTGTLQDFAYRVEDLRISYGDHQVIHGIDLTIVKNEVTALIGPSGCGKSTFLKSLNGMIRTTSNATWSGTIEWNGRNMIQENVDPLELRQKVGMVFQKPKPFPKSIYENVAFGPKIHGVKKKDIPGIVEKSLRDAYLFDEVKDRLHESALGLSGGQQQRLCIARALATSPDILLMDEPTSALDPLSTIAVEELILKLKEKYTVVLVTHQMEQAARISDSTAFFLMGELIECNRTDALFQNPKSQQTEDYITGRFG
ncbi:phosphate ABC transporter ATP-binding protein [Bacillaceae bacterium JMAK1]|nr:phosphate ABC transporter ATP-binding protein [Bacillaceae bacterium JMAK1]